MWRRVYLRQFCKMHQNFQVQQPQHSTLFPILWGWSSQCSFCLINDAIGRNIDRGPCYLIAPDYQHVIVALLLFFLAYSCLSFFLHSIFLSYGWKLLTFSNGIGNDQETPACFIFASTALIVSAALCPGKLPAQKIVENIYDGGNNTHATTSSLIVLNSIAS